MARERRRRGRLSRSGDFDRVYREGRSHSNRYLVLYAFPRSDDGNDPEEETRLGLSVGRKVGGAVDRSKVKRCLREAFWGLSERLPDGYDFVLVARPDLGSLVEREGTGGAREAIAEVIAAMPKTAGGGK
jgi:ribonuclease P protein component